MSSWAYGSEGKKESWEEKKKKKTLEYLQQLWDEVLVEDVEGSQIMGSKYKKILQEEHNPVGEDWGYDGMEMVLGRRK